MGSTAALVVLGLLLGSIPSGIVISRLLTGTDVRELGSGNFGAANVARSAGFKVGFLVALLDIAKGVVPVLIAKRVGLDHPGLALVALAAVLGHDFSLFLRLRGGKGVATTVGVSLVLAPAVTLAAAALWIVAILLWRYSSLASLLALAALPVGMLLARSPGTYVILAIALLVLGAVKHWENILRLSTGREPKFRPRPASGG